MTKPESIPTHDADLDAVPSAKGSRLISRLLPPAIRLWIHSQVDHIEGLDFRLEAKDRQLLTGYVPKVSVVAAKAVYRGLHISEIQVAAREIRVNLRQVLRGKPLRLLQPFPIEGDVLLSPEDLNASLQSALLTEGLQDVFQRIAAAQTHGLPDSEVLQHLVTDLPNTATADLADNQLSLKWQTAANDGTFTVLKTLLAVREGRYLCLAQPAVTLLKGENCEPNWVSLEDVIIDLGPEVTIKSLAVKPEFIEVAGVINVIPGDA
jgi:hypothetical protein